MVDYSELLKRLGEEGNTPIEKLEIGDICYLHDKGVEAAGGSFGIRDQGLLVSVTEAPYGEYFGQEIYPSVFDKAAKYLFDFSNYQIFVDGNKRTGVTSCLFFLTMNGYSLNLSPEKAYELVLDIANHKYKDSSEIAPIIKDNVSFIKEQDKERLLGELFNNLFR